VVAIAVSQLLLQTADVVGGSVLFLRGLGWSALVSVAYFGLHALFETSLQGGFLPVQYAAGPFQSALALAIVCVFLALLVLQQLLKKDPAALGECLYMHLYNGLYIDVYITRLLQRLWPSPTPIPETTPAPFSPVPSHGV